MNKILVCAEDGLIKLRFGRILLEKGFAHETTGAPIRIEDLKNYKILIIHSSYRLANLAGFIRNVATTGTIPVLFVSHNPGAMAALQQKKQPHFTFIDESRIDSELPLAVSIHLKYQEILKDAVALDAKRRNQEINDKLLFMAKTKLIDRGMSEEEAYAMIRKQAMDEKTSKYVIAEKILNKIM